MGHLVKDATGGNANCPVYKFSVIFENKWSIVILRDLFEHEARRFSDFRKSTPYMTDRALNQCLVRLQELKLVEKENLGSSKHFTNYKLSEYGKSLRPVFNSMFSWGEKDGNKWWGEISVAS